MAESDQIPLSDELLDLIRRAARNTLDLREASITPRTLLLSMLEDPQIGAALSTVVNREKVLAARPDEFDGAQDETLAFKTPDGRSSVWLSREAHRIFLEGAQRVEERYLPKHLALGLAAEAVQAPGVLAAIRVEPGILADAIYKL